MSVPRVTLFLRKCHPVFSGANGIKKLDAFFRVYSQSKPSPTKNNMFPQINSNFPFYLPYNILKAEHANNTNTNTNTSTAFIDSCFAIHIDNNKHMPVNFATSSVINNYDSITIGKQRSEHMIDTIISTHVIDSFHNNLVMKHDIPSYFSYKSFRFDGFLTHQLIDYIILEDNNYNEFQMTFDIDVATDTELGIDEEWDTIVDWAKHYK